MLSTHQENNFITNINHINSWEIFIDNAWDYHLSVTFEYDIPLDDYDSERGMSFLLKAVQRSVYSNQYIKQNDCFQGFSFAERHTDSKNKNGSFHFHNLINLGSIDVTDEFLDKVETAFREKILKLTTTSKNNEQVQIALGPRALHFRRNLYNQKGLAEYCIKDAGKKKKKASKISMINLNGAKRYEYFKEIHLTELHGKYYNILKAEENIYYN